METGRGREGQGQRMVGGSEPKTVMENKRGRIKDKRGKRGDEARMEFKERKRWSEDKGQGRQEESTRGRLGGRENCCNPGQGRRGVR